MRRFRCERDKQFGPHPEERALARVSKDGCTDRTRCHPSRRPLRGLLRMRLPMFRSLNAGLAAAAVAMMATFPAAPANAQAPDYPRRPITFIVGFAPGGGIDTFARVVAQELTEQAGFAVVIENRAGAASNIGGGRRGARRLYAAVHRQQCAAA